MTDGTKYAINKHLDEREDYDALQEVVAELEEAEAETAMLIGRIEELEAKLKAKEKLMLALAGDKIDLVSELAGVKGKLVKALELAEEAFEFNIEDDGPRAWHSINDRIEELKGQDDE